MRALNKRDFLRLVSGAVVGSLATPLQMLEAQQKLTNWAGNIVYGTQQLEEAASIEQIRKIVRSHERLKVLGTRHCFNTIADTRHSFLSLKPMREMELDAKTHTVTVGAGVKYGDLGPYLDGKGFALANLASLPHISVVGGSMTATHGSGEKNKNLSAAVVGLELVTASGDLVKLSRDADGEAFRAAVVGLGALGAVARITLSVEPTYQVRQYVYQDLPFDMMAQHFDHIEASGYSVSLFTDWEKRRINEVWVKSRVVPGEASHAAESFFGAKPATHDLHPIAELSAENCTQQMGVPGPWYDRLPHFRMGFTPSAGKELQSEYLVPRRHAVEAILAVERLHEQISPHLLITEIRTIAEDDLWMSTAYQRPSVAIHFTWKPEWDAVRQVLPMIERELSPFEPRPHWGKLFTMEPAVLKSRYEKFDDFVQVAHKYDPSGKFRNDFLDRNIFAS